MVNVNTML